MGRIPRGKKKIFRSRIPGEFRWDIVSLYKSGKEWQKDCSELEELLNRLSELKHRFTEESGFFLEVLQLKDEILQLVQKIYTYAHMCKDEDNSNNLYQSFSTRLLPYQLKQRDPFPLLNRQSYL